MKATVLALFLFSGACFGAKTYSQATLFSFEIKNETVGSVIHHIEKNSEFIFFYLNDAFDTNRKVNVKVNDMPVDKVLDQLLEGTDNTYKISDRQITILKKEEEKISITVSQQPSTRRITGTVADNSGEPIIGVNVIVKGTNNGTTTDLNGKFTLDISEGAILVFSYIGFIPQETAVGNRQNINIELREDIQAIEEVVVIGYGVQRKSDITGSIAQIKATDMENRSTTNVAQALQGKAAGVQIVNSSGAPGQEASIQIRGYSSNVSTSPLIIVDGLKVTNLNYLDQENIASIEILKDAASAAIYGIEAGNGVVLVTTKKGASTAGQGKVFYNFQNTSESLANMPKLLNSNQYIDYMLISGGATLDEMQYDDVTNTNWVDRMFETGRATRHTIGVEGGNDRGSFYVSFSYLSNDGIVIGDKDYNKRITGQINADYKIKNWLTVGVNTSLEQSQSRSVSEGSSTGISLLGSVMVYDPITPWTYTPGQEPDRIKTWLAQGRILPTDENGLIYGTSVFSGNTLIWHPMVMRDLSDSDSKGFNVRGTAFATLTPIKGLTLTSRFGYRAGYSQTSTYNYERFVNATATRSMSLTGRASNNFYYQWENFGNYLFDVKGHNFTVMAGMTYQYTYSNYVSATAYSLTSTEPNFRYLSSAVNTSQMSVGGEPTDRTNMSYFGRLSWSYMNKYNIQANFRADAYDTSKLDRDHRWGYFPSISAGWTISNESFMESIKEKLDMSQLRFRASYGINGNVNALGNYQYSSTLSTSITGSGYDFGTGNGQQIGAAPSTRLPNLAVKWETTRQSNIALEGRFLRDRLSIGLEYYDKNTFDLLTSTTAPATSGASTVYVNIGKVNNKGLETELGWRDSKGGFRYSVNGNISLLKNKVTEGISATRLEGSSVYLAGTVTFFEEGFPIWYLRTYTIEGVDRETGKAIYKDTNGDGIINTDDREYGGKAIPDFTYGLTVNLGYKNFDFTVLGAGVQGIDRLYALGRGDYMQSNTLVQFYEQMWTPANPNAKYPKANATDPYYRTSNMMVFDASFFKIKQIQLGYSIPSRLLRKLSISTLRAYVSFDDWFTFTKYPGLDPETSTNLASALAIDNGSYPISKKVVLGLNISF